ncbi:MAG TPA: hypothetical protein VFQ44_01795 [Streptosporangiaceae bacterium]|nr:hypothetical protein [Streptosporangiaceae bacterium]
MAAKPRTDKDGHDWTKSGSIAQWTRTTANRKFVINDRPCAEFRYELQIRTADGEHILSQDAYVTFNAAAHMAHISTRNLSADAETSVDLDGGVAATTTTTQKAAKIRADIKTALKDGTLGPHPEGMKISVRTKYASLMAEISVTLKGVPEKGWALTEPEDCGCGCGHPARRVSDECAALADKLMEIVRRHFTPDGRHHFADVSLDSGLIVNYG